MDSPPASDRSVTRAPSSRAERARASRARVMGAVCAVVLGAGAGVTVAAAWGSPDDSGLNAAPVPSPAASSAAGTSPTATDTPPPAQASAPPEPLEPLEPVEAPTTPATTPPREVAVAVTPLDDPTLASVVVNKRRPLDPLDYTPQGMVTLSGLPGGANQEMMPAAADAVVDMATDAEVATGHTLQVASAYRSYGFQQGVYGDYANRLGTSRADTFSARPGHSEHQSGWAVDVYQTEACREKACFADEPLGAWIADNAHKYGLIVRYPEGFTETTGYIFEPWHLRFVGINIATHMHDEDIPTLEDYFGLAPAPDYG